MTNYAAFTNNILYIIVSFLIVLGSQKGITQNVVSYTESSEDFMNPDRGFYKPIDCITSRNPTALTVSQLKNLRNTAFTPYQGNYSVRTSLILRQYVLDAFINSNLSSSFLNNIVQADFDAARESGVRLIIRFCYTITPKSGNCGSWICPPYGDAPKSRILGHIAQLKSYFQSNSDVIAAVQSGFIGVWGEQYYTDYFGDASKQGRLTDQNWKDRNEILRALLDAVPSNRMVQVRYPQLKQRFVYNITAPVTAMALTEQQAHKETYISRIGFHNDCFLSAPDDQGTYWDYGTSTTLASNQTPILKRYSADDSKYVVVGGETCDDNILKTQNDCVSRNPPSDMDYLNYSYLNADYNSTVNNDWQEGGCMDAIKKRLGYRFVMVSGNYPTSVSLGNTFSFNLDIRNVGFAAPFNPRSIQLILRNTTTNQVVKLNINDTNADIRRWYSGQTIRLNPKVTLPNSLPVGKYSLLLHIFDKSNNNTIANRPEYSIRLANTNTWEEATGYNKLNHTITVSTGNPTINIDGANADWHTITPIVTLNTGNLRTLKAFSNGTDLLFMVDGTIGENNNIFINSDNNTATGYKDPIWSSSGSDYLLQNGQLLKYNGNGTNWSWTQINVNQSDIKVAKSNTVLEAKIPKASIIGLASSIKIGVETSNNSWIRLGTIPALGKEQAFFALQPISFLISYNPIPPENKEGLLFEFYPNPSFGALTLSFINIQEGKLEITLYSLLGTPIKHFIETSIGIGKQEKTIALDDLPTGTYFVKVKIGEIEGVKRLVVLK